MDVKKNQIYKTKTGKFLKVVLVTDSKFHHFIEVVDNINQTPLKEIRNNAGHVTRRVKLEYSEEIISTFKKMKAI